MAYQYPINEELEETILANVWESVEALANLYQAQDMDKTAIIRSICGYATDIITETI